ncbi:Sec-independent protein translocase subunit TatA/TatB [Halorussus halophilus]|uniref:Sec-independent protein translocase subunit TatA/TatB n=1 Tax=Halorussus halophilus TaxID=2650975 RepID=UPI0017884BD5
MNLLPLFGPIPGGMEMMVILLIVILLFGANKLPKLARSTGEAMGEFKKGREDIEREIQEAANGVEQRDEEYETEHTDDETTA